MMEVWLQQEQMDAVSEIKKNISNVENMHFIDNLKMNKITYLIPREFIVLLK